MLAPAITAGETGAPVLKQGPSVGAVWLLSQVARQLGITAALGSSRQGKLALWQVIARVLDQGSRLSAVRLAGKHAVGAILGLTAFDADDLYANLDWLAENQESIEKRLAAQQPGPANDIFLYDVTSTYLEGAQNAFAAFGYNRDRKQGKRQIVIGLLCNGEGCPLSIEVFAGNTSDVRTFSSQVSKAAARFGATRVTFVGDRGMIKGPQIAELGAAGFHYITAITKAQIEALIDAGLVQMSLFDAPLAEVQGTAGERYILRRNPVRAAELAAARKDKLAALAQTVAAANNYLADHPRAKAASQLNACKSRAVKLRVDGLVALALEDRCIAMTTDDEALTKAARFDGCHALRTDLPEAAASKEVVHDRYKDLAQVEQAFRDSKQTHLEIRPVYVRNEARTRGHALVVMLAYLILRHLRQCWQAIDGTVQEALDSLAALTSIEVRAGSGAPYIQIPAPRDDLRALFEHASVSIPTALPSQSAAVSTRRKLRK
jgi:transposase